MPKTKPNKRPKNEPKLTKYTHTHTVTTAPNHIDIVRFGPKKTLTALKRVYLVKRSLYIYSVRNLLPYPMWDITNTPPCRHNVLVVSHGITGPNRQTPLTEPNKPPHRGRGSALIPFVTTRTQPYRYCPLWAQEDPHGFKTRLLG